MLPTKREESFRISSPGPSCIQPYPTTLVPVTATALHLVIIFQNSVGATSFCHSSIVSIISFKRTRILSDIEIISRNNTRVDLKITSAKLQTLYDNMLLQKRYNIKQFNLCATGPQGRTCLEVHLRGFLPMLLSSHPKSAKSGNLGSTETFHVSSRNKGKEKDCTIDLVRASGVEGIIQFSNNLIFKMLFKIMQIQPRPMSLK